MALRSREKDCKVDRTWKQRCRERLGYDIKIVFKQRYFLKKEKRG